MTQSIYIHIPFCLKKCGYCDFASYAVKPVPQKEYTDSIITELRTITKTLYDKKVGCGSVYFGGGTPSLLSPGNINRIIDEICTMYDIDETAEITMEVNPKTAGYDELIAFRAAGVNRLSIGAQSFDDSLLKRLGRVHDAGGAVRMYENALSAGFDNINIDLIFGIPGQSHETLLCDLKALADLEPAHVSAYILTVAKGSPLYNDDDDAIVEMFNTVEDYLTARSYKHYEVSNYARGGRESAHNLNYWRAGEYIGLGAAAHSMVKGERAVSRLAGDSPNKAIRWRNTDDYKLYMEMIARGGLALTDSEPLDEKTRMNEFLIMGLRLADGIMAADFRSEFGKDIYDIYGSKIKGLCDNGLMDTEKNSLKLTKKRVLLLNEVLVELI